MNIEQEIKEIKERNKRVEAEKAWETSLFRKTIISLLTYIISAFIFYLLDVSNYLLSAVIPTTGYFLSVQTIPFIKEWWINNYRQS